MVETAAGSTVPRRTLGRGLRDAREAKGILAMVQLSDNQRQALTLVADGVVERYA